MVVTRDTALVAGLAALERDQAVIAYHEALAVEAGHRAEVGGLEDRLRVALLAEGTDGARRASRADAAWLRWIATRRARVDRDLALSVARRMESLAETRRAFARASAAHDLHETASREARRHRDAREEATLQALALLALGRTDP
ncbi:hypothetical protein [Roseivivax isoporae]|uniref:Flagellar FliJ protein n=1 Tax=Roseivivax isoporae LMG 25204 TaxID=1449351 RepID=X7F9Y1_9RHOB|nr:hypothetical protein [Roseivivax isoporae]ETX29717.1 hypothetical protein RISW2_22655 [Roseivivax isoporae LMG 25204]